MNLMQESVLKFITQSGRYHSPRITNDYSVECTSDKGKTVRLTGTMFFDIRDADTNEIIAISDLPHSWETAEGMQPPKRWEPVENA